MKSSLLIGLLVIAIIVIAGLILKDILPRNESTASQESEVTQQSSSKAKVKIEEITEGSGKEAKSGDTVVVNYKGTLQNGSVFDSSYDRKEPFTTKIGTGSVIKGWDEGIPGMKVGGKRRLTIPPELGYGAQGAGDKIPPNSILIFEVELVDVK